jgi:hypothetical protein
MAAAAKEAVQTAMLSTAHPSPAENPPLDYAPEEPAVYWTLGFGNLKGAKGGGKGKGKGKGKGDGGNIDSNTDKTSYVVYCEFNGVLVSTKRGKRVRTINCVFWIRMFTIGN